MQNLLGIAKNKFLFFEIFDDVVVGFKNLALVQIWQMRNLVIFLKISKSVLLIIKLLNLPASSTGQMVGMLLALQSN